MLIYYLNIVDEYLNFWSVSTDNAVDYYFSGWYTDPGCAADTLWDFSSDRVSGVSSAITLYAGWVNKATVNNLQIDDENLTDTQIAEFNKWYARLTTHEKDNFGSMETAKKYWYKYVYIKESESASEPWL